MSGDPVILAAETLLAAGFPEESIILGNHGACVNEYGRSAFLDVWGFEWTANVSFTLCPHKRAIVKSGNPAVALKRAMERARVIAEEHASCLTSIS